MQPRATHIHSMLNQIWPFRFHLPYMRVSPMCFCCFSRSHFFRQCRSRFACASLFGLCECIPPANKTPCCQSVCFLCSACHAPGFSLCPAFCGCFFLLA